MTEEQNCRHGDWQEKSKSAGNHQGDPGCSDSTESAEQDDSFDTLSGRVQDLQSGGGGTLELDDGIYGLGRPLVLPQTVSLCMAPHAVLRALPGFKGDAVLVKDSGESGRHHSCGWIRGGIIDGGRQPLTGLKVVNTSRLDIAQIEIRNAAYKGIHVAGWYEINLCQVRCNLDLDQPYAPHSVGIHYESGDSLVQQAHIIGYETGLRCDAWSNMFSQVHVWNADDTQGPMIDCFYCNGHGDSYMQCYADSPTRAGFNVLQSEQSFFGCRTYYSRWAEDNAGAGVLIGPDAQNCTFFGNNYFAKEGHALGKAFDGCLDTACIVGECYRSEVVKNGMECRIPSGNRPEIPMLNIAGQGFRCAPRTQAPDADEGDLGDVCWVDNESECGLYIRTSSGWKRARLESP